MVQLSGVRMLEEMSWNGTRLRDCAYAWHVPDLGHAIVQFTPSHWGLLLDVVPLPQISMPETRALR